MRGGCLGRSCFHPEFNMIDVQTGTIRFNEPAVEILPSLTRAIFLATSEFSTAKIVVANEPWCSSKLSGYLKERDSFAVILWFRGENLWMVTLMNVNPAFGTSWADWSSDKEQERMLAHDRWLELSLGSKRNFEWGNVCCEYDEKGGFSQIAIKFS